MKNEMTLHNPLTDEEWRSLTDAELENTTRLYFETPSGKKVEFTKKTPGAFTITEDQAEAICDHYCRVPNEYDEDLHGIPLAESEICKNCPLTKAAERGNG